MLGTALDGMGPDSPAYTGLATQYVAALLDAGTAQEAVAYAESVTERLRAAEKAASWELAAAGVRARCSRLGARRTRSPLLDAATAFKPDDPVAKERRERLLRALVLATLDRLDEAVEALPDLDVVGEHPRDWVEWAQVVATGSAPRKITNTWQLGRVLRQWIDYFAHDGRLPRPGRALRWSAAALAIGRQGVWQARLLADVAEGLAPPGAARSPAVAEADRGAARPPPSEAEPAEGARRPANELVGVLRRRRRLQRRPRALGGVAVRRCPARTSRRPAATPPRSASSATRRRAPTSTGGCSSRTATRRPRTPRTSATSPAC